jgi:hypothetical protein
MDSPVGLSHCGPRAKGIGGSGRRTQTPLKALQITAHNTEPNKGDVTQRPPQRRLKEKEYELYMARLDKCMRG